MANIQTKTQFGCDDDFWAAAEELHRENDTEVSLFSDPVFWRLCVEAFSPDQKILCVRVQDGATDI